MILVSVLLRYQFLDLLEVLDIFFGIVFNLVHRILSVSRFLNFTYKAPLVVREEGLNAIFEVRVQKRRRAALEW